MKTFSEFKLNSDIQKGLKDLNFVEPTVIQAQAIPFILKSKKDLIALAQTGTGKTAAFSLPIINNVKGKNVEAIILCPTRELAIQIAKDIKEFAKYLKNIKVLPVYGGERIDKQIRELKRGINIVIGTPGRVNDLIRRRILKLNNIKYLVLDEADEMLDMGFKEDLDTILKEIPSNRQTLLFSATMPKSVYNMARNYMNNAEEISAGEKNIAAQNITHQYYVVDARDRFLAVQRLLDSLPGVYSILFCRTRRETQDIADKLKKANYNAEAIHGDISQATRTKIMENFKEKRIKILVATDVAARGIDVKNLTHIINYNLPDKDEIYTHRSGRTGRAKKSGIAISLLNPREVNRISSLENIIGNKFEYQKLPKGEDIFKNQINNFIKEIEDIEIEDNKSYKDIINKFKKFTKEDLIKYFVINKFSYFMDSYKNTRNLDANFNIKTRKVDKDSINIRINFGKRDRFGVKDIFGLINRNKNLRGIDIGRITLTANYSEFSVKRNIANKVIINLEKDTFQGQNIEISISNEKPSYSHARKKKKRNNYKRRSGFRR